MTQNQIWKTAGAALVLLAILAGCGSGGDANKGKEVYETGGSAGIPCNTCHTLDGTKLVGPSFQGIAARAGSRVEGLSAEEYLRESIMTPSAHIVEGYTDLMPAVFGQTLSEDEVNGLIAFLMTQ